MASSKKKAPSTLVITLAVLAVSVPIIVYLMNQKHLSGVTLSEDVAPTPTATPDFEKAQNQSPTPTIAATSRELGVVDQKKFAVLKEILSSRNDNDPRMDTELKHLSAELKAAMVKAYHESKAEARNDRGTIVFLVGREIKTNDDVEFLKAVLLEKPCLSLSDCSRPSSGGSPEEEHLEVTNETSANYPQLMANRQMLSAYRKITELDPENPQAAAIVDAFRAALNSPNPRVADEARRSLREIGKE